MFGLSRPPYDLRDFIVLGALATVLIYIHRRIKMEETKKKRRSAKEIREDMIKINQRKPSKEELTDLVNIINENAIPDQEDELVKIAIKRENNGIEQTRV